MYTRLFNQYTYHDILISTKWYYYQAMQLTCMSYWNFRGYLLVKESQIDNALVNVFVIAKAKIINNHPVTPTLLITLTVELAATYKASQLAEVLGL